MNKRQMSTGSVDGFYIDTDANKIDMVVVHGYISHSYWAKDIPMSVLQKAIDNSLCFSLYSNQNKQVGFARLITDKASFAYLADVFVIDEYRGKGLSKWLISTIVNHPDVIGLRRMMLATRDAHGLYAKFGFLPIENPEILMQIWRPNIYQSSKNDD